MPWNSEKSRLGCALLASLGAAADAVGPAEVADEEEGLAAERTGVFGLG